MNGAPVLPIPIGNRWRDSDASNLPRRHIGLFVAVAARDWTLRRCSQLSRRFALAVIRPSNPARQFRWLSTGAPTRGCRQRARSSWSKTRRPHHSSIGSNETRCIGLGPTASKRAVGWWVPKCDQMQDEWGPWDLFTEQSWIGQLTSRDVGFRSKSQVAAQASQQLKIEQLKRGAGCAVTASMTLDWE